MAKAMGGGTEENGLLHHACPCQRTPQASRPWTDLALMTIVSNQKLSGDQELAVNTENWRMITDRYAVRTSTFFLFFSLLL
jgi:hypothetical protein